MSQISSSPAGLPGNGPDKSARLSNHRGTVASIAVPVVIAGGDEFSRGEVSIKDMVRGRAQAEEVASRDEWLKQPAQVTVSREDFLPKIQEILDRYRT